jgi:predicted AlkP superfamily pyrophosphatase or phosphodiesterase
MILKYQPDLLLIHPCPLDTQRHKDGVFSDDVTEMLEWSYKQIEELYDAVKQIGEEDNTDFVWMSDHGQFTLEYWYRFLIDLREEGLIKTDEKCNLIDENIELFTENPSVLMKVKDKVQLEKIYASLKEKEKANTGIKVFNREEFNRLFHINKDYDLLIDSDGVIGVGREAYPDEAGNKYSTVKPGVVLKHGTHGFSPDIGYQPTLIAIGPDFKPGVKLDRRETVCVPVTLAKCIGVTLEDADGTVIEEILK